MSDSRERDYDEEMAMYHGQKSFSASGKSFDGPTDRDIAAMIARDIADGYEIPDFV